MPTELEELVEFLHHGNTQIRQIACENLVGYSSQPSIFKKHQLLPVRDLKLLVRDYPPIAKNALTILINLSSHDEEIRANLAEDDGVVTDLVRKITNPKDPNPSELSELLANLSVHPSLSRLLTLRLPTPPKPATAPSTNASNTPTRPDTTSTEPSSNNQPPASLSRLLDLFVTHPSNPAYDHLSYLLASLSGNSEAVRKYFLTPQSYDGVTPLSKIFVFTDHSSLIRRRGVASTLKNVCFEINAHPSLLSLPSRPPPQSTDDIQENETSNETDVDIDTNIDILPYILLPLAGSESYPDDEMEQMLPDLQLLPPDKEREPDNEILVTHLESLTLLTTTREGRERLREVQVYPIIRECHAQVRDEAVGEAIERLVNVLMRDEEGEGGGEGGQLVKRDQEREIEEVL